LAIAMTHAVFSILAEDDPDLSTLAAKMHAQTAVQTFYGSLSWESNGIVKKPMYGKQKQEDDYVIVAPEGATLVYPMVQRTATVSSAQQLAQLPALRRAAVLAAAFAVLFCCA